VAPNAPLRAAVTALAGLLKLRKRPFVCPEPKWLVWVDSAISANRAERLVPV